MNSVNPSRAELPLASSCNGMISELIIRKVLNPPSVPGFIAKVGNYDVIKIIGRGGMGIVLLVKSVNTGNEFALKLICPELSSDVGLRHRFVKEAGHMTRLHHPNIVRVIEVVDDKEGPYFVMPYFKAGNLASLLYANGPLSTETILDISIPLARGLLFAHQRGIIHRDLKPANILINEDGSGCLADFGLARTVFNDSIVDPSIRQCEGTAHYMSPAVAAGNAEDTRCDIYSFGSLLYEMVANGPPYEGPSVEAITRQILTKDPKPIESINPKADSMLIRVIEGAMGRELRNRYADMSDVIKDLERVAHGLAPHGPHGIVKRVRRNFAVWQLLVVTISLASLSLIGVSWYLLSNYRTTNQKAQYGDSQQPLKNPDKLTYEATAKNRGQSISNKLNDPMADYLHFKSPVGIVADNRTLFVVDSFESTITKISEVGGKVVVSGIIDNHGIVDGQLIKSRFFLLKGIALGPSGYLYVTDAYQIRKIIMSDRVSVVAGVAGLAGYRDGEGSEARFRAPSGLVMDKTGSLIIADEYTIRKLDPSGRVSTLAGLDGHRGWADGMGTEARFGDQNKGIAIDKEGNIYIADSVNCEIRKLTREGRVSTFAGCPSAGYVDGLKEDARFSRPTSLVIGSNGTIYVSDTGNKVIRSISTDGFVRTFAGLPGHEGFKDGKGSDALFEEPSALAVDADGVLYVCDVKSGIIRKILPDGTVSTLLAPKS